MTDLDFKKHGESAQLLRIDCLFNICFREESSGHARSAFYSPSKKDITSPPNLNPKN